MSSRSIVDADRDGGRKLARLPRSGAPLLLPTTLRRLYIARDADAAGDRALAAVTERAAAAGIEVLALSPRRGHFNDDLQAFGLRELRAALRPQLAPQDASRFIPEVAATAGWRMTDVGCPGRSGNGAFRTAPDR